MSEPTSFEGLALILGRVEGKVDTILAAEQRRDEQIARLDARMSAVETKLSVVEAKASQRKALAAAIWSGAIAVIGILISLADAIGLK